MLSAGQALWRVGSRSFVVQHYRSRLETGLTNTDTGMRVSGHERGPPMSAQRHEWLSDAAVLAVIGAAAAVAGDVVACGAAWPARCSGRAGRTWASSNCSTCSRACRAICPIRPAPGRPPIAHACPARAASTGRWRCWPASAACSEWPPRARPPGFARETARRGLARASSGASGAPGARSATAGSCSDAGAAGCSTPSTATRWSRSGRRSRASRPASRSRRCSTGTGRPSPARSRPTCWRRRRPGAARSARCSCSIRSGWPRCPRTPGRRCALRGPGTARSRSRGGSPSAAEVDRRKRGGRRLLGGGRRAAPRPAALHGGRERRGHGRVIRWVNGQGTRELDQALMRISGEADDERAGGRRVRRLRRGEGVRGPGRPHPHLDRGDRSDAAARLPLPASDRARPSAARSPPTACSTAPTRCT